MYKRRLSYLAAIISQGLFKRIFFFKLLMALHFLYLYTAFRRSVIWQIRLFLTETLVIMSVHSSLSCVLPIIFNIDIPAVHNTKLSSIVSLGLPFSLPFELSRCHNIFQHFPPHEVSKEGVLSSSDCRTVSISELASIKIS